MQQKTYPTVSLPQKRSGQGGIPVRTGLRGGVCVEVNDQVKSALQTLTTALGGTATAPATPVAAAPAASS